MAPWYPPIPCPLSFCWEVMTVLLLLFPGRLKLASGKCLWGTGKPEVTPLMVPEESVRGSPVLKGVARLRATDEAEVRPLTSWWKGTSSQVHGSFEREMLAVINSDRQILTMKDTARWLTYPWRLLEKWKTIKSYILQLLKYRHFESPLAPQLSD